MCLQDVVGVDGCGPVDRETAVDHRPAEGRGALEVHEPVGVIELDPAEPEAFRQINDVSEQSVGGHGAVFALICEFVTELALVYAALRADVGQRTGGDCWIVADVPLDIQEMPRVVSHESRSRWVDGAAQ